MGFALLVFLTLLAALASVAVAARWYAGGGRAELASAASIVWTALIVVPLYVLGWANALDATNVALASSAASIATVAVAWASRGPRAHVASTLRAAASIARIPLDAIALAWRERSLVVVGLVACAVCIAWTAWLTWLAPSSGWDALWYHDSIVGFAIQNRGFRIVDTTAGLEFVNGYPKTSELLNLWWVLFVDNRLIELTPSVMGPILLTGFYALARRFTDWRVGAMGLAAVLLLLPGVVLQMRSSYIDVQFVTAAVLALVFVTRPLLRARDSLLVALALGLLGGMKGTGLVLVPAIGALWTLRTIAAAFSSRRPLAHAGTWLLGGLIVIALMAPIYVRNWILHENPTWPVTIDKPALGIHWQGVWEVEMPRPFEQAVKETYSMPLAGRQYHDAPNGSYGIGAPWIVPPLFVIAFVLAIVAIFRGATVRGPPERNAHLVLLLCAFVLPTLAFSPALYIARFNLHGIVVVLASVAWLFGRPRLRPLGEGTLGALVVTALISLWWASPGWEVPLDRARELAAMDPAERAAQKMTPVMGDPEAIRALDRELGLGDVVAYMHEFGFPAVLWNEEFSNRLVFVPFTDGPEPFLRRLEKIGAKWAVARTGSAEDRALRSKPMLWVPVGKTSDVNLAYRRSSARWEEAQSAPPARPTPPALPTKLPERPTPQRLFGR